LRGILVMGCICTLHLYPAKYVVSCWAVRHKHPRAASCGGNGKISTCACILPGWVLRLWRPRATAGYCATAAI